jgi:hypothetical protein
MTEVTVPHAATEDLAAWTRELDSRAPQARTASSPTP